MHIKDLKPGTKVVPVKKTVGCTFGSFTADNSDPSAQIFSKKGYLYVLRPPIKDPTAGYILDVGFIFRREDENFIEDESFIKDKKFISCPMSFDPDTGYLKYDTKSSDKNYYASFWIFTPEDLEVHKEI